MGLYVHQLLTVLCAASVVIPTRNRKTELREAIRSVIAQSVPVEVLVMDDGATDGTGEMVRSEFPEVRYERTEDARGPAYQRNRGIFLSSAPVVFPIDDDSVLVSAHTIQQTLAEFAPPRVGAVAIPFINVRQNQIVQQHAPAGDQIFVTAAYVGAAHAVRRDVFLKLGGYREHFFYMGEESDFCVRLLQAGYVTRLGRADPIHHLESPARNLARADHCGRRNDVLYAWHNVPSLMLLPHLAVSTLNGLLFGLRVGRPMAMARGILSGYAAGIAYRAARAPVPLSVYRLSRHLKKSGAVRLDEIEPELFDPAG